jgi:hypothetical protein
MTIPHHIDPPGRATSRLRVKLRCCKRGLDMPITASTLAVELSSLRRLRTRPRFLARLMEVLGKSARAGIE